MKKYKDFIKSIIIVMGTQAAMYFLIKTFITNYHMMSSTITIPFIKEFAYFYGSWYPMILFTAFVVYKCDKELYKRLTFTMILGALFSHLTFIIYPTMITRPEISVNNITDFIIYFTYETDTPVNCLPSVHCLYCFITSYYIIKCKTLNIKNKLLIVIYHLLIILSTLFIHQHVIEDTILALIYTIISILIVTLFKDKFKKVLEFMF